MNWLQQIVERLAETPTDKSVASQLAQQSRNVQRNLLHRRHEIVDRVIKTVIGECQKQAACGLTACVIHSHHLLDMMEPEDKDFWQQRNIQFDDLLIEALNKENLETKIVTIGGYQNLTISW